MKKLLFPILFLSLILTLSQNSYADIPLKSRIVEERLKNFYSHPAAFIITDGSVDTFNDVRETVKENGGFALQCFPPEIVFARFTRPVDAGDFDRLDVRVVTSVKDIPEGLLTDVEGTVLRSLFNAGEWKEGFEGAHQYPPIEDRVLRVPEEVIRNTKFRGPRKTSSLNVQERGIQQNSEFMIGSVVVNLIFPESVGGSENWTDEELANALVALTQGISQYQQYAIWAEIEFFLNYKDFKRLPVSMEPIEGNMSTDYIWICEALGSLGYGDGSAHPWNDLYYTHQLNNDVRARFKTDWVFTVYVVDMSAHYLSNECWRDAEYVAYSYLGGPYMLVPYPACSYGYGSGFGRVFIHEMSHIFWALDEYAGAGMGCEKRSGYLNYANRNTLYMQCQATVPCIMQTGHLEEPFPICRYTLGQVGIADDNDNGVPDVYDIAPEIKRIVIPGVTKDTIFDDMYLLAARVENDAVPNMNSYQDSTYRIDYAPHLSSGEISINKSPFITLRTADGDWDEPHEDISHFISGMTPGYNDLLLRVRNHVGLGDTLTLQVYYIGIKYFYTAADVGDDYIDLTWVTPKEIFGAVFQVMKTDLTLHTDEEAIATIEEPDEIGSDRRAYSYRDTDIKPGHRYSYRIYGSFSFNNKLVYKYSREILKTAMIPVENNLISYVLPNPTSDYTTFTINVPKSYYDPTGGRSRVITYPYPSSAQVVEVKTPVDVSVYNVMGQRIKTIYSRERFGGLMTVSWDGTDRFGRPAAAGVYFLRVKAGDRQSVKKIVIIR